MLSNTSIARWTSPPRSISSSRTKRLVGGCFDDQGPRNTHRGPFCCAHEGRRQTDGRHTDDLQRQQRDSRSSHRSFPLQMVGRRMCPLRSVAVRRSCSGPVRAYPQQASLGSGHVARRCRTTRAGWRGERPMRGRLLTLALTLARAPRRPFLGCGTSGRSAVSSSRITLEEAQRLRPSQSDSRRPTPGGSDDRGWATRRDERRPPAL